MVAITANLLAQLGLLNGCALNLQAILDVAVCPNGVALDLPTGWATDAGDNALVLLKGGATKHKRDTCEAKTTGAAATGAAATGAVPSAVNTPASQVTSALAATSGVPSGVVPSAVIPSGAVPTGATTKVPGAVTTGTGAVPTVVPTASATTGLPATSVTTGLSTATGTCSTSPVTVDPLDVSLGLDVADTVSLQVLLGVLDLINADLDVSIDLAGLLDLMVKLNINILDLVDLNLDVDTSLGGLINALVNLDLNISVGDLLNLNLDLGVDLSPLSDLGDDVAVTLGDILNLVDCTVDNVVAVVDGLLTGIAPIIGDVLHIVDTLVTDVLGTVNSLLSALIHKREGDVFAAAKNRRDSAPSHPIVYVPTCGSAISPNTGNVTEVPVSDLTECVSKCHLTAAGGLLDIAANVDINLLDALNVHVCLGVSILGDVLDDGKTTCRFATGQGYSSLLDVDALISIDGATHYAPQ